MWNAGCTNLRLTGGSLSCKMIPIPQADIPANTQVATGEDYTASGALNLIDFLARDLAGFSLIHVQNNPFQPDVLYRGFTSSFLLGTPPGLSVFVDGVRLDEPLADQVNWDLVPADVIERIELIPGSNPVYGRNTLGGALAMQTKRGRTNPGTAAATRSIASTQRSA